MIRISGINKKYGNKTVLKDITFEAEEKKTTIIMGESGCGKTTLLRIIAGLEKPDSGKVELPVGRLISMVFQEYSLLPWLSAIENVSIVSDKESASKYLNEFGLGDSIGKYPCELSGGMRQRVSLARAFAYMSDIMLMDEPFKGLDSNLKEKLMEKTSKIGRTIIMVTHDRNEAEKLGDKIININEKIT